MSNTSGSTTAPASRAGLAGWVMFDWAAQPFYTLIQTFLFAPYFASVVAADPARGQALWGYAAAAAGIAIAVGSPILGAIADRGGRRKPWIVLFGIVMMVGMSLLWLAEPGIGAGTLAIVLIGYGLAFAAAEFAAVFNNAMMAGLVRNDQVGRLSGIGWGVGYAGGLISLVVMAGLVVTSPTTGRTMLGLDPLLALDTASRAADRLVGPFSAAWFALFILPFLLLTPDRPAAARPGGPVTIGDALASLGTTIRRLPQDRDLFWALVARMLYADGLAAIFVFGGIYGASVFGWRAIDLGIFGIILALTSAIGAVIGGFLDDRIGAKRVIIGALVIMLGGFMGILSVDKGHVLFTVPIVEKAAGSASFSSSGEMVFLAFAVLIGLVAAPVQAAGRSLLVRLAPPDRITQYFGLFAFSGKATAFLAPLLIALVTSLTGSQRWGISVTALFLVGGLLAMLPVREPVRG